MKKWGVILIVLLVLTLVSRASASDVTPVVIPDYLSCQDLGYRFGFIPDLGPPPTGTYPFPGDPINTLGITSDGTYLDWSSTISLDAVLVRGISDANLYTYVPESYGDTGLHAPIDPNTGNPYNLSQVEVCYDYELMVEIDARPFFTRVWEWLISQSVVPNEWWLFAGENGTSTYEIETTKTGFTENNRGVEGTISIFNPSLFPANIQSIAVTVGGLTAAVDCGVSLPYDLTPSYTLICGYNRSLPDGTDRISTVVVSTLPGGFVGNGEATADVTFGEPTAEVNSEINVIDTNGQSWTTSDTLVYLYTKGFDCSHSPEAYTNGHYSYSRDNVATIVETGQDDNAHVDVHCYAPVIEVDAYPFSTYTWEWMIDKWADQTELVLSPSQVFPVNYDIAVNTTGFTENNRGVEGTVIVTNPNPMVAMNVPLTVVVSPDLIASLDCGGSLLVPAGGTASCDYSRSLPDETDRVSVATTTLNGIDFTATAEVVLGSPTTVVDEYVDVNDTVGFLGTVYADQAPFTFDYSLWIDPYHSPEDCGDHYKTNLASFVTNDLLLTGEDSWDVHVLVPCELGCTLTPDYWRNHSQYGPAEYPNDTWELLPNGPDTTFLPNGQSYYEILWALPQGIYYDLAPQWIAARLNELNGASVPGKVLKAMEQAETILRSYTPAEVNSWKGGKAKRVIGLRDLLYDYNQGNTGPGSCSE